MRVAILLTGLDEVFPRIKNRILSQFDCEGIEFDFFGHTWEEKITVLNSTNSSWVDISQKFVRKNKPFPYNDYRIKNYKTSSYQEIYDKYISREDIYQIVQENKMIFFMSYMSQNLSTYYAFQALEEYKNKNNLEYDFVIKWRWDLLFDEKTKSRLVQLKNHKENEIYSPFVDDNQMSDFWYCCKYDLFKVLVSELPDEMSLFISEALTHSSTEIPKNQYHYYHERMILECFKKTLKRNNINAEIKTSRIFIVAIFRPELKGNEDFWEIHEYNKSKWINKGWESRNIKDG